MELPVIFITAKGQLKDRTKGLDMGADDYIVKPFEIEELISRVNAVISLFLHLKHNLLHNLHFLVQYLLSLLLGIKK